MQKEDNNMEEFENEILPEEENIKASYSVELQYATDIYEEDGSGCIVDDGYDDLEEARKCFEWVTEENRAEEFLKSKGIYWAKKPMRALLVMLILSHGETETQIDIVDDCDIV
jgi:hypothetical protein